MIFKKTLILSLALSFLGHSAYLQASEENPRQRLFQLAPEPVYTQDDIEAEVAFGRELASKILGKYPVTQNKAQMTYVNKVGQNLAIHSQRTEIVYHFAILDTPIINAFAAPGGYIFITQGALDQAQDEAELAAILGHEFGHIEERHYVKQVGLRSNKGTAESGLTAALSGGGAAAAKAFNEAVNETMEILFTKGLKSKEDEYQADAHSVWLLTNTGYDPSALKRYFERIQSVHTPNTQTLAQTHPPMDKRIAKLNQLLQENELDQLNYARLQERFNENR